MGSFQELRDQEKHIEQLRGAVRAKGQPLKVAQACFAFLSVTYDLQLNNLNFYFSGKAGNAPAFAWR